MATVDLSQFMVRGHQYTVSLKSNGWYRPLLDTVSSELQFLPNASGISVKLVGGVFGLFADQFDVSFWYIGDGADVVAGPVNAMIEATSIDGAELDFIGAVDNTASGSTGGIPTEGTDGNSGAPTLPSSTNITTWLVLGVIGLGLVVFLTSGGPGIIRRATA